MRAVTLVFCAALVGCASSGGSGNPVASTRPPIETIQVRTANGGAMPVAMVHDETSYGGALAVGFDQAWLALRVVYDSLGIPVTMLDQASHTIGNTSFKIRRQLGKVPLSRYINCGNTQGGSSADSYEIILTVVSSAQRKGDSTLVMTRVDGQGRPVAMSGDYVHCATKATLEQRIVEMVRAATRQPSGI